MIAPKLTPGGMRLAALLGLAILLQLWTVVPVLAQVADTLYVLGGPARGDGKFQRDDDPAMPDAEGWIGRVPGSEVALGWNIDPFNAQLLDPTRPLNHAMWCGELLSACRPDDPPQGYRNNCDDTLDWFGAVAEPTSPVEVTIKARLNHDVEPDYDYVTLEAATAAGWEVLSSFTGANRVGDVFVPLDVMASRVIQPEDLVGDSHDKVHLRWHFVSDGGYSDADCDYPSAGAAQVDNIAVDFAQHGDVPTRVTWDDFESGSAINWVAGFGIPQRCVTAKVWPRLYDLDPVNEDLTPAFAFVDDGSVCPGTPGTPGGRWTYGPGGFVIPCLDSDEQAILSPAIALPSGVLSGAALAFDTYVHRPLSPCFVTSTWAVRASSDGGVSWGPWRDSGFVYFYTDRTWTRQQQDLWPLLPVGATHIQVSLGYRVLACWQPACYEWTPAPYYDNVSVTVLRRHGTAAPLPRHALAASVRPNPFNPRTRVEYMAPGAGRLTIDVHDARGRLVRHLFAGDVAAGPGGVDWDGTDESGRGVGAGVYFAAVHAAGETSIVRLALVR